MEDSIHYKKKLLNKYYSQTCTAEERLIVKEWLSNLDNDLALQVILKDVWDKIPVNNEKKTETDIQWKKWLNKADLEQKPLEFNVANNNERTRILPITWLKWAAILLPLVAISIFYFYTINITDTNQQLAQKDNWINKETTKGQKLSLTLPDGSLVKLNSSSKLSFSKNFMKSDARIVKLEGEAFFEVTKMNGLPFIVETENLSTTVLGTAFGVKCYPYNKVQYVAVLEGKVKVEQTQIANKVDTVFLIKDQMASLYNDQSGHQLLSVENFEKDDILGWKDGILVFKDESLNELIVILEEWYGVDFIIKGNIPLNKKFTGTFKSKPLSKVLEGIGFSSRFDYEIIDSKVLVSSKSES